MARKKTDKFTWNYVQVVRFKDGIYQFGYIIKNEFKIVKKYKTKEEIDQTYGLQSSKKWLSIRNIDKSFDSSLYTILGAREYWIVVPPIEPSEKEWDKFWWSAFNEKCLKCIHSCKESFMVDVMFCNYKKGKE